MKQVTCEENKQMGRMGADEELNSRNFSGLFCAFVWRVQICLKLKQTSLSLGYGVGEISGITTCFP